MKKKAVLERIFECPCCHSRTFAYKSASKMTKAGHIKTMYCYKCKELRNFEQVKY